MSDVVEEYVDQVVETRRRTVHVTEACEATVSAWHGGRRLCDLGTRTSVAAAVRHAESERGRFSVGPGSSLRLRVEERTVREWRAVQSVDARDGYVLYGSEHVRPSALVLLRHAWDSHDGFIEPRWTDIPFSVEAWVGIRSEAPPHALVRACFAGVAAAGADDAWLHAGYGLGGVRMDSVGLSEAEPDARIRDRADVRSFLRAELGGILRACGPDVPEGADMAGFLASCDVSVRLDRTCEDALAPYGRRPVFWVGEPAIRIRWGAHALPAPFPALCADA